MLGAGAHQLSVQFTPTNTVDYRPATATVSLVVNPAVPVLTWPAPAPMLYGTPLGDGQLNAVTNVSGALVYSPGPGWVLNVGAYALGGVRANRHW